MIIYTRSITELQIKFRWWNWWGILVEVHVWYMVETSSWWVGIYMRCIVDDVGTSWWVIVYVYFMHYWYIFGAWLMHLLMVQVGAWLMHLFMVQDDYKLFGIGWCMVDAWLMHLFMVQVDYRLIGTGWFVQVVTVVYLTVAVWKWFYHSTSTSGRLDEARTSGCSHLPVVVGEHRGCSLLLVVARGLGIWSFP